MITNKNIHVTKINSNMIQGQYIKDNCPKECLCRHREDLYDYITAVTVNIPLNNIYSIIDMSEADPDECKEVMKVSILGISTEFIRSVIIRLRIYSDNVDTEVTTVDMEVGKTYNVQYFDQKDHTMYEIEGVLENINIDRHFGDEPPQTGFVRPECSNPEQVGIAGMVYYNQDHFMDLPKDCPEKVVFIFDTSKFTDATHDFVRLVDIRDIYEVEIDGEDPDTGSDSGDSKCCNNCPFMNPPEMPDTPDCEPPFNPSFPFMPPPPHHEPKPMPYLIPPKSIIVSDDVACEVTPNGIVLFKDKHGVEINRISIEGLVVEYAKDKY